MVWKLVGLLIAIATLHGCAGADVWVVKSARHGGRHRVRVEQQQGEVQSRIEREARVRGGGDMRWAQLVNSRG
jgi:hypothetical protein